MQKRNIIFAVGSLLIVVAVSLVFFGTEEADEQGVQQAGLLEGKGSLSDPNLSENGDLVGAGTESDGVSPSNSDRRGSTSGPSIKESSTKKTTSKKGRTAVSPGVALRERIWSPDEVAEALESSEASVAPTLNEFFKVNRKHQRTSEEEAELAALLSDPTQARALAEFLTEKSRKAYTSNDEALRLTAVSFLNAAIGLETNPVRQDAVAAAKTVVLAENIDPNLPRNLKVSLAGDKVELAMQMILFFPESRNQLVASSTGTNHEIIQRASDYVGDQ